MEESIKEAFLELLRSGLWGHEPDFRCLEGLGEADWQQIFRMAGKQTVIGVCIQAVFRLPEADRPPQAVLWKWIGQNLYVEARSRKMLEVWREIDALFVREGIQPILMKGLSVGCCYAKPLSRQAGDIDLFIPEGFDKALELVRRWGCPIDHKTHHDSFDYQGVHIELHPRMVVTSNRVGMECMAMVETLDGVTLRVPDAQMGSLLLLSHAARHFLIGGIGYRYLCDWAAYLNHYHAYIDTDRVCHELRKMGLAHFVADFTEVAHRELGLSFDGIDRWRKGAREKYVRRMSAELTAHGDFGAVNFKKTTGRGTKDRLQLVWSIVRRRHYWPRMFWKKFPLFLYSRIKVRLKGLKD